MVITIDSNPAGRRIESQGEPMTLASCVELTCTHFWVTQMSCFVQKNVNMHQPFCRRDTYHRLSNPQPLYHPTDGSTTPLPVCWMLDSCSKFLLSIEATDYRSNFAKTILFENCSCFSKIPFSISVESPRIFQCLISIPAGH